MSILELLGLRPATQSNVTEHETESVRQIVDKLDHLPEDEARFIATYAALLSRVARADLTISAAETREMERLVMQRGGLDERQSMIVVQMAKTQNLLFGGTENYLISKEFHRIASREQKLALLDCLFAVSAADDAISTVEDGVIRQIADELRLEHAEFIAVRSRYRDRLAVLQPRGRAGDAS